MLNQRTHAYVYIDLAVGVCSYIVHTRKMKTRHSERISSGMESQSKTTKDTKVNQKKKMSIIKTTLSHNARKITR